MTFDMDSPNFSLTSLQEIVICKNNSICNAFNLSFDIPIHGIKDWSGRALTFLQSKNIIGDELAPFTYKHEKIKADMLDADIKNEEEEKKIDANLGL